EMARKDDPVFNVKFVELVEKQACLWNYTHPGYSKKEEVQRAWQHVANEIKDTVRNSRERWRTIRSSFLRSLKLARTQTGRGKRKYYLSKYLQFLIPYTKSRACHKQLPTGAAAGQQSTQINPQMTANGMVLRKPSTSTTASTFLATLPMTRIGHMRQHQMQCAPEEDTKDSSESIVQPSPVQSEEEPAAEEEQQQQLGDTSPTPLRLQTIKVEQQQHHQQQQHPQQQHPQSNEKIVAAAAQHSLVTLPGTMAAALRNNLDWADLTEWFKCNSSSTSGANNQLQFHQQHNISGGGGSNNMLSHQPVASTPPPATGTPAPATPAAAAVTATVAAVAAPPDADYSFLISLHPYLKEMSGKQNRRFRQKVVGLIDNVLDNVDI
ncbi:hypothetical protein KR044_004146, partial [Drosophila immigrans]